jgi:AcrR family transcriptional regulator
MVADRGHTAKYRIAETAMALFLEQGYENVTVEAVAEASRISRRTVFRHFAAKDELAFPDHADHLAAVQKVLDGAAMEDDPVETVIAATEASLRDFLSAPELVLRRYELTRVVRELRNREIIEHERYIAVTGEFLRSRLPATDPPFKAAALAALIDAMHRSALGNWVRSQGATDALAELRAGMDWIRQHVRHGDDVASVPLLVAVLPDSPSARAAITTLRDAADERL